ncbi:hypothetical protein OHA25_47005 [Nonomuraea sp. NBC_00507]|uniref:hypothetical protein n=1 Tax=Nonomuraea sp. NBC_00507 TaxID=2976002 RepID=UPI002E18C108
MSQAHRGTSLTIIALLCFIGLPAVAIPTLSWLLPSRSTEPPPPDAPCPADLKGAVRTPTQYTDKASPYQGAGPHPMRLVEVLPEGNHDISYLAVGPGVYEANFHPEKVQLVACEYAIERGAVLACEYSGLGVLRPMRVTYVYRVYEAKTSRFIKEFRIGTVRRCPNEIGVYNGERPNGIREERDRTALEKALAPLVERPAKDG